MYFEYWGLKKPPFDNVPDPSMYVDAHESVENTIAEALFAIEEGNECIAVIVGDVGLGKTLSLRMILDSLEETKYKVAFITNPDMSFIQLLREIVGQLSGAPCEIRGKIQLLETFNRCLFETADEGKKVLIFVDEANAMSPSNLESLRLLTNMQDDTRNLFTVVLAGQIELARRLEHPNRANLFQRVGTYSRIEKIKSEELVRTYVETRLRLAGATCAVFADDAFHEIWEHSEHGVPRLINKICKLSLKAGETNGMNALNAAVVKQIGERFQKMTGPLTPKRKPRRVRPVAADMNREIDTDGETPLEPMREPERTIPLESVHSDEGQAGIEAGICGDKAAPAKEAPGPDEVEINGARFLVSIPPEVLAEAVSSSMEQRDRLAGALAARTLERHPGLTSSASKDPVKVWGEIRDFILIRLAG